MSQENKKMDYKAAGVDIDAGNRAVELMKNSVRKTLRPECLTDIGGFGGLFALDIKNMEEPVLVSGTDGVGTKLKLAFASERHDTIGIDCVAMCVNDIIVSGAEPLFFLDYLAVGKLEPEKVAEIVSGVAEGCRQAGCALIGGETAEMPGFYSKDEYDIAGFAVGVVDKKHIIDGSKVKDGDAVIALPSSGFHSNGYSLVRAVFKENEWNEELIEKLIRPTKIYVKTVKKVLAKYRESVHAMAHITGGGLTENIPRVLPENVDCVLSASSLKTPEIFRELQLKGNVSEDEMRRTFNMGAGFILVVDSKDKEDIIKLLAEDEAYQFGEIESGKGVVRWID